MNKLFFSSLFRSSISYWALLCLFPMPILYCIFHHCANVERIQSLEERMEVVHARKEQSAAAQKQQSHALSSLSECDSYYIDKHLETLTFLESEIKKMQMLVSENSLDDTTQKRLQFLKEGSNRLLFAEDKIRSKNTIREVSERQQHPIETNEEDLKKLLCLIEGVTIWPYGPKEGRPQLLFQDFHLSKKPIDAQDHVFVVTMNLIKRENNNKKEQLE